MCFPKVKKKKIIQGCLKIYKNILCHVITNPRGLPRRRIMRVHFQLYYIIFIIYLTTERRYAMSRDGKFIMIPTRFYKINFMYSILLYCTG